MYRNVSLKGTYGRERFFLFFEGWLRHEDKLVSDIPPAENGRSQFEKYLFKTVQSDGCEDLYAAIPEGYILFSMSLGKGAQDVNLVVVLVSKHGRHDFRTRRDASPCRVSSWVARPCELLATFRPLFHTSSLISTLR